MPEDKSEDSGKTLFSRFFPGFYRKREEKKKRKAQEQRDKILNSEVHLSQVNAINESHDVAKGQLNQEISGLEADISAAEEKYQSESEARAAEKKEYEGILAQRDESIQNLTGNLEAAESNYKQEKERADGLHETVQQMEEENGSLKTMIAAAEKESRIRTEIQSVQAEKTRELLARLVLSESLAIKGTNNPVMFLDSKLKVIGINDIFTKKFGYKLPDLTEKIDIPEGVSNEEIDYSRKGLPASRIVANAHNLKKIDVLNQYFYPKSRDTHHYEICLRINPKTRRKKYFGFGNEEKQGEMFMAYVRVAIYDGQFIGASFELAKMSRQDMKKIGVDYILNRDAVVTAAETIDRETAEEYRQILTSLYTHDLADKPKTNESKGGVEFDFINTKEIKVGAIEVFMEMYDFCTSPKGRHLNIYFSNLKAVPRTTLFDAGIPADFVHGTPKKEDIAGQGAVPEPTD